ncbi:RNA polymerase sigma factor [Herbaspirillum robiniae]|uniref:RNA polymerase subunit sigma-70 n=1 Tax=Herbaspirillum robiniae TaxID=2014887 RepID=A0A2D0B6A4_9BURK|nr:RNA polymerase sigma factor [Herbaspirillum robiniae]OWY29918.1 RNA polymerase subunit sigma-70 [Herbaspirillum robiniae]
MSDSGFKGLRDLLTRSYADLKRRLTLQLGNADLASDALQDIWVRLETHKDTPEPVQHPLSYLMRMATNSALDKIRSEKRFLRGEEVELIFESMSDPAPGPEQVSQARSESERLLLAMEQMPARQRRVLTLIRVDEMSRQEVADYLGISVSLVDRELKRAHEFIVEKMR